MTEYVLTLRCHDQPGIVHAVTAGLLDCGSNIVEQAQFTDPDLQPVLPADSIRDARERTDGGTRRDHRRTSRRFDPVISLRPLHQRRRVLLMVSRFDHCLVDLLYRHGIGELQVDIP